jgi:Mg2+ and Co2+ transporter CorA
LVFFRDLHSQADADGEIDRDHLVNNIEEIGVERTYENDLFENFKFYKSKPKTIETKRVKTDIFNKHFDLYDTSDIAYKLIGPSLHIEDKEIRRPRRLVLLTKAFAEKKIRTIFGLNIVEFLKLSSIETELLLESAQEILDAKAEALEGLKDQMSELEDDILEE